MKFRQVIFLLFPLFVLLGASPLIGADKPVTPNPSPEAVELLEYIYSISGKHTLTG